MKNHKQPWRMFLCACSVGAALWVVETRAAERGLYFGVDVGASYLASGNLGNGSGNGVYGGRVDLMGGYNFNQWLGAELEVGVLYAQTLSASIWDVDVAAQVPVLGNIVLRYENPTKWVPYIGAGAGIDVAAWDDDDKDRNLFAWQLKAGVRRALGERASLGLGYKFLQTQEHSFGAKFPVNSHTVCLTFNLKF